MLRSARDSPGLAEEESSVARVVGCAQRNHREYSHYRNTILHGLQRESDHLCILGESMKID